VGEEIGGATSESGFEATDLSFDGEESGEGSIPNHGCRGKGDF